jgi:glutamate-ammonia-ligase adenylyltransferase
MKNSRWTKVIKTCADPQRAKNFVDLLAATDAGPKLAECSEEQVRVLVTLLAGSQALGELLVANPDWLGLLEPERLRHPRRAQGLRREIEGGLKSLLAAGDYGGAFDHLRRFKQMEMLRIAARDLSRLSNTPEIIREISDVADVCLDSVWRVCRRQFHERHGHPYHQDPEGHWHPTSFCVLGMGKLGGQELNYSSDVDVLFVYSEEGEVFRDGRNPKSEIRSVAEPKEAPTFRPTHIAAKLSSHQYFNRLAETFIAEVSKMTAEGSLFRIDLRLRPEGNAGPLCRSLASYENYYAQWGQTWERMMLIKARCVAGYGALAAEFLEMVQPFRFPRSVSGSALREVAAMKDRIENELLCADELERNVKLGRGGIREIEFVVQAQQLLHGGRIPFLQSAQTLPGLDKLVQYHLLKQGEARQLQSAYEFLRDAEHRLQMDQNLQTHTIPADRRAQERLARLMGFPTIAAFQKVRQTHTRNVRRVFDGLFRGEETKSKSPFPPEFDGAEAEWKAILARHWFRDVDKAFRTIKEFVEGPGFVHVSSRTVELARQLLPRLFALCRTDDGKSDSIKLPPKVLSDPDRVVTRLDSFISVYGARAALFELWNSNPSFFELLLVLFDRSEFLAEALIRSPELLDDLIYGGRLTGRKTAQEILKDLRHGLGDEDQHLWLRRYHEAELTRLGLRDILGLADFEQNLGELSALADACLQYALEVVMRKRKLKSPPFVIIGLGKLGGNEINYGSDLDILFVTGAEPKDLPGLQRLAAEVMDLVSRRTDKGATFQTDARLRPDGEKGLLVNTLSAYEEYYLKRAQLWELQSLTRTRPVAGDFKLGEQFQQLAARVTDFSRVGQSPRLPPVEGKQSRKNGDRRDACPTVPACFTPDWKQKIHEMRLRIEKERTPTGKDDLAIKTGRGGLMDAEFMAQALCLEHGWQEAHTLRALERARDSVGVQASVCSQTKATLKRELQQMSRENWQKLIENYRQLRRVESILRRWSYEGETVLPDDPAPYYRVSVRCGFATPAAFRAAMAQWRLAVREVYVQFFGQTGLGN